MLVKLTDTKGVAAWINPIHVKMLREKKGTTEIFITPNPGWSSPIMKVRMPMDEVAMHLNAGMPDLTGFAPDDEPQDPPGGAQTAFLG